jgi:ribosomal protein L29
MKHSEIKGLSTQEIKQKIAQAVHELSQLQLKKSISPSATKDTSVFQKLRRSIAQMKSYVALNK